MHNTQARVPQPNSLKFNEMGSLVSGRGWVGGPKPGSQSMGVNTGVLKYKGPNLDAKNTSMIALTSLRVLIQNMPQVMSTARAHGLKSL